MTEQMVLTNAVVGYPPNVIRVGDVIQTHCTRCMTVTDKLYTGYSLICLWCHPEMRPEEEKKNGSR